MIHKHWMITLPTDVSYSSNLKVKKKKGRDDLCSSNVCLHRNFSNNKIWVIPPHLYWRLAWQGALVPLLPMPSHLFPITSSTISIRYPQLRHHEETTGTQLEPKHSCLAFAGVEMFPKTLHPLQGMPVSRPHSYSPARLCRQAPCYFRFHARYQTLNQSTLHSSCPTICGYGLAFLFPLTYIPSFQFWVTSSFSSPVITAQLIIFPLNDTYNALPKCFPTLRGSDFISNFQLSNFAVLNTLLWVTITWSLWLHVQQILDWSETEECRHS